MSPQREDYLRLATEVPLPHLHVEPTVSREAPEPQGIVVRRITELRAMPDAEVEWLAERFLAVGAITDLVAYIKTGKTTLMSQLIAAVLHGERMLGLTVKKAPVVLLSEERVATLLMALEEARIEDLDDLHVLLWNEQRGLPWAEIVRQARAYCEQVGAKLLVVDTLGMWADVDDEKEAGEAKQAMIPLLESAVGIAIAVLRQARKSGGEIHNAGRGSGAYGGAADILLHLDYTKDDKGRVMEESSKRSLTIKSRLEREAVPPMELDYTQGRYFSGAPMIIGSKSRESIRQDLKENGRSSPAEIAARTGLARNTVIKTLGRMEEVDGHQGVYELVPAALSPNGDTNGDKPVTTGDISLVTAGGDTFTPPLGGVGMSVTAPPPVTEPAAVTGGRGRYHCPNCHGKPYTAGPQGLPQRRCHGCGQVWTP